jgi:hypothetical protein
MRFWNEIFAFVYIRTETSGFEKRHLAEFRISMATTVEESTSFAELPNDNRHLPLVFRKIINETYINRGSIILKCRLYNGRVDAPDGEDWRPFAGSLVPVRDRLDLLGGRGP